MSYIVYCILKHMENMGREANTTPRGKITPDNMIAPDNMKNIARNYIK